MQTGDLWSVWSMFRTWNYSRGLTFKSPAPSTCVNHKFTTARIHESPTFWEGMGDCAMPQSVGFYQSVTVERFGVETPRPLTSVTWWLVCWMSWYRWGKQLPALQKNKIKRSTSRRHVPCLQVYLQQKMPHPLVLQNLSQRKLTFPMPHISITFHYQNISKHPNWASKDSSHHPSVQVEGSLVLQHEIPSPSENAFF